jgi:hypothetical protein
MNFFIFIEYTYNGWRIINDIEYFPLFMPFFNALETPFWIHVLQNFLSLLREQNRVSILF